MASRRAIDAQPTCFAGRRLSAAFVVLATCALHVPSIAASACGADRGAVPFGGGKLALPWTTTGLAPVLEVDGGGAVPLTPERRVRSGPSPLYSRVDDAWWLTDFRGAGWTLSVLSHEPRDAAAQPVAAVLRRESAPVIRLAAWISPLEPQRLERLYAVLLRLPPELAVDVIADCGALVGALSGASASGSAGAVADASRARVDALLRHVAELRAASEPAGPPPGPRRWRVVDIVPRLDGNEPLKVSVRIRTHSDPLAGATVVFAREPHLMCTALTDAEGVAACELFDTHGHTEPHDTGPEAPPTIATFSGRVSADELHVPLAVALKTPVPTRCLSDAVPADVAAGWQPSCRGFAPRTWSLPSGR